MPTRPRLLSPRWLATHLLVVLVAAVLGGLGVWQLQRLGEVRATQARVDRQLGAAPVAFGQLPVPAGPQADAAEKLEYRRVRVTGTYMPDEQVLQRSRTHEDRNGFHVLTPLRFAPDSAVLVRRGWVPDRGGQQSPSGTEARPPQGEVTVTGYLERSDPQPGFGPTDPDEGRLEKVFHADVTRLDRQVPGSLHPMVLHLQAQQPPQAGELPIPAPAPELDTTQNLSYAIQWFSFAVIGLVGYAAFVHRHVRDDREGSGSAPEASRGPHPSVASTGGEA